LAAKCQNAELTGMAKIKLFAVIDVGSHEIQMVIAEIGKTEPPRMVERVRRTLAIGTDTYMQGKITQPVLNECMAVLSDFVDVLKSYHIGACRVVATSAFREAQNASFAIDQVKRGSGLQIQILSNAEEQYFHILAATSQMPAFPNMIQEGMLLVNIGSGSIQLTVYSKGEQVFSQNMLIGSLRIRELLADLERRTADFAGLMEEYISTDLNYYHLLEPKGITYKNLVILGGETGYLKKLAGQDPDQISTMSAKQFSQLYRQLVTSRPIDLASGKSISVEHASLLLPSAIIIQKVISFTGAKDIIFPSAALCDGMLIELAQERYDFRPVYDQSADILSSCRHLASRFEVDRRHTEFVEKAALQIFDETSRLHGLPGRSRVLLQAAAILHDSGKYINLAKHSIRSHDIIRANEIIGLKGSEQDILAWAARMHSGRSVVNERNFLELSPEDQLQAIKLAALLRLADALDYGHKQKVGEFTVSLNDSELVISVAARRDITLEIWSFDNKGKLFQDVFGVQPVIKVKRQLA
jgi:exopolyphosphatase / guanosine-5'-triphosphate,3'-diphosphate pyrophosphatase